MRTYRKWWVIVHWQRWMQFEPGLRWAHAMPGGGPVLLHKVSWRTISGVMLVVGHVVVWVYFRRRPTA